MDNFHTYLSNIYICIQHALLLFEQVMSQWVIVREPGKLPNLSRHSFDFLCVLFLKLAMRSDFALPKNCHVFTFQKSRNKTTFSALDVMLVNKERLGSKKGRLKIHSPKKLLRRRGAKSKKCQRRMRKSIVESRQKSSS